MLLIGKLWKKYLKFCILYYCIFVEAKHCDGNNNWKTIHQQFTHMNGFINKSTASLGEVSQRMWVL